MTRYDTTDDSAASPGIAITKTFVNYVIIALVFLGVGGYAGYTLWGQQGAGLDEAAVRAIVREELASADVSAGSASSRFDLVDDDPYLGAEDAPVVIVEFSDFRCPYCGRHYIDTLDPLLENYGQYIRYVYRDFAALGPESVAASLAAECANEQGKFWEFHDTFFNNQGQLGRDFYLQAAADNELDVESFTACVDEDRYLSEVSNDGIDGQLNGVAGTPGFFINGQFIRGAQPYEVFERVVLQQLERAGIDPNA